MSSSRTFGSTPPHGARTAPYWSRWLVAVVLLSTIAAAQAKPAGGVRAKVPPDPYTQGDPELLARAGYVSLGPFPFGAAHTTTQVADLLGTEPLLWIETEHFRIGCSLPAVPLKGEAPWQADWVRSLKAELKRLAAKLPRVSPEARTLDPWLRAHLFAQRLEDLYAEVLRNLGATDESFGPEPPEPDGTVMSPPLGRYLGLREKFTVLLLRTSASHARYTRAYQGKEMSVPVRFHDREFDCMYWGASEEMADGLFRSDFALHSHLVYNVSFNLYSSYRGFNHELPPWFVLGLAHWHSRRVTPRFPPHERKDDKDNDPRSPFWQWGDRVPGLLQNGAFEPVEKLLERTNGAAFGIEQHMQAWSLLDFLMTRHQQATMRLLHMLKEPFHRRRKMPTADELRTRQLDALRQHLGWTPQQLEAAWRESIPRPNRK
jgi:hypothetical protein